MYGPRTLRRLRIGVACLSLAIIAIIGAADRAGYLDWLENPTADLRARTAANPAAANPDIVWINIDNASFQALSGKLGRWPWTRRVWTELLNYITPAQPKVVLFDILFEGSEPAADPDFAAAINEADNVVLPFAFVSASVETKSADFAPPALAKIDRIAAAQELNPRDWSVSQLEPSIAAAMAVSGSNLWTPDPDGMTRRLPLAIGFGRKQWMTTWLAAAQRAQPENPSLTQVAADSLGRFVPHWHGDTLTTYPRIPLWEMICSIYPTQCDASVKRHAPAEFADKIVLIGASAAGSYEVRPTPVSETAPGTFVIATAIDNLLANRAVALASDSAHIPLIALLTLLPAASLVLWRPVSLTLLATTAAIALYTALAFYLYRHDYWLPLAAPTAACLLSFSGNLALRYFLIDRELSRTRGTLERYVSPQLVRHVMDHLETFRFDGEKRRLTVFFSDVRGFTTLTEKSDPAELLKQLNEYLEVMTEIVFKHDGILDKFIGDGIMAHWGAFTPDRPNALLAARASLEMQAALKTLNERWQREGRPPMNIGIGLNSADVIFGNVGAGKKLDFTAIGDGVNLAARLEAANKDFG